LTEKKNERYHFCPDADIIRPEQNYLLPRRLSVWKTINLRSRIYLLLGLLVLVTLTGGAVMVWYSIRMQAIMSGIIDRNLAGYEAAEALETALVNQKGFVSYFFLDGDPNWLRQLNDYRQIFTRRLEQAYSLAEDQEQRTALERIESEYRRYIQVKDRVIVFYKQGDRQSGARHHPEARQRFFRILTLCENYKDLHKKNFAAARQKSSHQAKNLATTAGVTIAVDLLLVVLLASILLNQILIPLRQLSLEADRGGNRKKSDNEVQTLRLSVHGLMDDIDQTHFELEKSREHLLQAEKMALVGKLAASMAHSIRNPFTSVKMRLFSLERSLELSEIQKDDLQVISEEIRHIDNIVQNFLEFSRPPKLRMQAVSPSAVVDSAIQLLEHRLKSYDVEVEIVRKHPLPDIYGDPEQLKEVLVNLVVNACEAMGSGGRITIKEALVPSESALKTAVISLIDTGPGIPASISDKIFQPFFTTKEDGTGLGLSIAARIIEEHRGRLEVQSVEGNGATFNINLPIMETDAR